MTALEAAKLGFDVGKQGLCFICDREVYFDTLEEDLKVLRYERGELMNLVSHVRSRYQELQRDNPPRLISYNLNAWVNRVDVLDLEIIIHEGEEEIGSKCTTFLCPKNVCDCNAVGRKVTRRLEYVKELSKEGREYANVVDAIPNTVSLHLQTGRTVPVDGLRLTDLMPPAPGQP